MFEFTLFPTAHTASYLEKPPPIHKMDAWRKLVYVCTTVIKLGAEGGVNARAGAEWCICD